MGLRRRLAGKLRVCQQQGTGVDNGAPGGHPNRETSDGACRWFEMGHVPIVSGRSMDGSWSPWLILDGRRTLVVRASSRLSFPAGSVSGRTPGKRPNDGQTEGPVPPAPRGHGRVFPPFWSVVIPDQWSLGTIFITRPLAVTAGDRAEPVLVVERQRVRALLADGTWFLEGHNEGTELSCSWTQHDRRGGSRDRVAGSTSAPQVDQPVS